MSAGVRDKPTKPPASALAKLTPAFMREAQKRIASIKIDRTHDIPYLAGSSADGKTMFIDRHIPKTVKVGTISFDPARFLVWHEIPEKMLTQDGMAYQPAHQIATHIEKQKVTAAGIDWNKYEHIYDGYIDETENEADKHPPKNLDLIPYKDEHDQKRVKKLDALMRKP